MRKQGEVRRESRLCLIFIDFLGKSFGAQHSGQGMVDLKLDEMLKIASARTASLIEIDSGVMIQNLHP